MTILIPYRITGTGGPHTFVRAMTRHLSVQGHTVIHQAALSFNVLLVIAECSLLLALYAKLTGRRLVQRLDGVYHPGLPGTTKYTYPLKNLRLQIIHNFLADHVIYQSKFAKLSCQTMLGKRKKNTLIIYNGVESPEESAEGTNFRGVGVGGKRAKRAGDKRRENLVPEALKLITFASFRRLDQIKPILESVKNLTIPYHLHIYGPHTKNLAKLFSSLKSNPSITYHGAMPHQKLLLILSQHHIFLFSDQSACPNAVLESLAAGLPVVAFSRGSISELIQPGTSGEIVNLPTYNPFHDSYPFTQQSYRQFARAIVRITQHLSAYRQGALKQTRQKFNLKDISLRYEKILSQNTPSP